MIYSISLTYAFNLQGGQVHLPMFPIIKVQESSQFNTPDKVDASLFFDVLSVISLYSDCTYSPLSARGIFTPPPEIIYLTCYCLHEHLILFPADLIIRFHSFKQE